jgi:hypothetical protein
MYSSDYNIILGAQNAVEHQEMCVCPRLHILIVWLESLGFYAERIRC